MLVVPSYCSSNLMTEFFDNTNVTSFTDPVANFFENTTKLLGNLTGFGDDAAKD
jgi:hypothetical protein